MAMTKAALKALILSKRAAAFGAPDDSALADKDADALADAIVTFLGTVQVLPTALISGAPGAPVTGTGELG